MDLRLANRWTAVALFALVLVSGGCGVVRRGAVSTMVPILRSTMESTYRDQDLETVGRGIPANLLLIRGMAESDPGNRDLWALTAQLYFYYAFGFVEEEDPERSHLLYEQGLALGKQALVRRGWFRPSEDLESFKKGLLKAKREDVPLLFWTSANWVSWISLRMNDPAAIADMPLAEASLERVLALDPTYFLGIPHAMAGTLKASKPVLLGGNPEEARRHFEEAFRISGRRLLIFQTLYAQYYCRSALDQEGFVNALEEVLRAPAGISPEYRLLNEVARRRASRLMELKDDWF